MQKKAILSLVALFVSSLAGQAGAIVITFDDLETPGPGSTAGLFSYESSGFELTDSGGFFGYWHQGHVNYLDSAALTMGFSDDITTLATVGGGVFTLNAIDLDSLGTSPGSSNVEFFAYDAGNNQVGYFDAVWAGNGWNTFNFGADFQNVAYVQWEQGGGATPGHQFDNITLNMAPIPEPATVSLLAIGLAGLVARSRRSQKII